MRRLREDSHAWKTEDKKSANYLTSSLYGSTLAVLVRSASSSKLSSRVNIISAHRQTQNHAPAHKTHNVLRWLQKLIAVTSTNTFRVLMSFDWLMRCVNLLTRTDTDQVWTRVIKSTMDRRRGPHLLSYTSEPEVRTQTTMSVTHGQWDASHTYGYLPRFRASPTTPTTCCTAWWQRQVCDLSITSPMFYY